MAEETKVLVSLPRLERLITSSMWDDAIGYICRFLPPSSGSTGQRRRRGSHLSEEAQTLLLFLHMHKSFADVSPATRPALPGPTSTAASMPNLAASPSTATPPESAAPSSPSSCRTVPGTSYVSSPLLI